MYVQLRVQFTIYGPTDASKVRKRNIYTLTLTNQNQDILFSISHTYTLLNDSFNFLMTLFLSDWWYEGRLF